MDISFCSFSVGHIEHIIQIFFENTSNIHEDARICLNISLSNGYEAYGLDKLDGQSGQTFGRTTMVLTSTNARQGMASSVAGIISQDQPCETLGGNFGNHAITIVVKDTQ
jgi:hypothetical protein